jgi:hypothetical protein
MAYMVLCAKMDRPDLFVTGDNPFLNPDEDMQMSWEYQTCYSAADTMLEMLRSDILKAVRGNKEGLLHITDPWAEGIAEALEALGWKLCGEVDSETGAKCEAEVTWTQPHGRMHVGYSPIGHRRVLWVTKEG